MSPGLKRARQPYLIRNALTGLALGAFAATVWAYSISAVKQDVFDDIDEEARALQGQTPGSAAPAQSASRDQLSVGPNPASSLGATKSDQTSSRIRADEAILAGAVTAEVISLVPLRGAPVPTVSKRGVLQHLDSRFPNLLDPHNKTIVWGAPPVDDIGTISGSRSKPR